MNTLNSYTQFLNHSEKSGFFKIKQVQICQHPAHKPPTYMVIPQGEAYKHVCPGCGSVAIIRSPFVSL